MRAGLSLFVVLALLGSAAPARAQLPAEGQPIETSNYNLDLYQGPVLSANRVIGLGGAFVAIADGVEGGALNPAAAAARTPYSDDHFDYDLGLDITFPQTIRNTDFWNSGHRTQLPKSQSTDFLFFNLALQLQFGRWGFGLSSDFQHYSLLRAVDPSGDAARDRLTAQIVTGHAQLAHAFLDGQLLLGAGLRAAGLSVTKENRTTIPGQGLFSSIGSGFEAGFIWRPNDWQIRVGGAYHAGSRSQAAPGSSRLLYPMDPVNRLYLPTGVALPWDINLGFAAQIGPRPLNPRWVDPATVLEPMRRYLEWRAHERDRRLRLAEGSPLPGESELERRQRLQALLTELHAEEELDAREERRVEKALAQRLRERYHQQKRFYVLVTTSIMFSGPVENAVGVESMLDRTVQRSGQSMSVSPHLGVETEILPHYLCIRGGSYLEPSRFDSNQKGARLHATFGFDQRVFAWDVFGLWPADAEWRVGGSIDASRSYLGWGISIGNWH